MGIKLAVGAKRFVCQIVGDGTFLFSVPGSVYWISHRYKLPVLTIVLNNQGKQQSLSLTCNLFLALSDSIMPIYPSSKKPPILSNPIQPNTIPIPSLTNHYLSARVERPAQLPAPRAPDRSRLSRV